MNPFIERHKNNIAGVISCFDRVIINGTLPDIAYAGAMQNYLYQRDIRFFDFPRWAEPRRDEIRTYTETLAAELGVDIVKCKA